MIFHKHKIYALEETFFFPCGFIISYVNFLFKQTNFGMKVLFIENIFAIGISIIPFASYSIYTKA